MHMMYGRWIPLEFIKQATFGGKNLLADPADLKAAKPAMAMALWEAAKHASEQTVSGNRFISSVAREELSSESSVSSWNE